jgi:exopolyphosphatase/guanosine-5'-triphosphate,3'-diphosphate pyrophosphatase
MSASESSIKARRFGAIDIGSNAVRLLIKDVDWAEDGTMIEETVAYYRVPLRLGAKVFDSGRLSSRAKEDLGRVMQAFRLLMDVQGVHAFRACATSALRTADNDAEVIAFAEKASGIVIDLISGKEEADLILSNFKNNYWSGKSNLLCIDVGGGSMELSVLKHGSCVARKSFKLGTVRMLKDAVDAGEWKRVKKFIEREVNSRDLTLVGTGGNINRFHKVARIKKTKPLPLETLEKWIERIKAVDVHERSEVFGFKHNRSDVIVPAGVIYRTVMALAGADEIYVPKVGLADGIILKLAEDKRVANR